MSDDRRRKLMLVVLAVLVVAAAWRLVPGWIDGGGGGAGRAVRGGAAGRGADAVRVATLDFEALAGEPMAYQPGRNPFTYYTPPPPPPPPGPSEAELRARAEAERMAREERERELAAQPPPEPPKPQPPPFQLTFLGSFGPESRRIAVFTDGETIYNALVGDVLEQKFVVADIGYESVTITYVGFPDEPATRVGIGS
jgi:hypothetical protein